jgi:hypothetical protein
VRVRERKHALPSRRNKNNRPLFFTPCIPFTSEALSG